MKHLTPPTTTLWARAKAFSFAVVASCLVSPEVALADETRISVGYGTVDLHLNIGLLGVINRAAIDGKGYWFRAEGDEGDFLYSLSFGRHSATGTGVIPPSPPEIPIPEETDLKYPEIQTVGATLGWHGLNLDGLGFGPFIAHERVATSGATFTFRTNLLPVDETSREQTVAGVLLRKEGDDFDFSATAGSIVSGDAWEHGLAMSIAADIHVSDSVTLTGDWVRAWGKQTAPITIFDLSGSGDIRETAYDTFGLGGRVKVADRVFLESWMTRARNGTNIDFGQDNWITTLNIGIGTSF